MDSSIASRPSKVRGSFLPEEYELTRLIENITIPLKTWNDATPACKWDHVVCNDHERVTELLWSVVYTRGTLSGTLQWHHLPKAIRGVFLQGNYFRNEIKGSIDVSTFPQTLQRFSVATGRFSGTIDFSTLPISLISLNLSYNFFTGLVDATCLPPKIIEIKLNDNIFLGTPDLSRLPNSLKFFAISHTHLALPDGTVPECMSV